MGMFDQVIINGAEIQTKAFGKNLQTYNLGDKVQVFKNETAKNSIAEGGYGTYQVEGLDNELKDVFIDVFKDCIIGFSFERNNSIPLYSYNGHMIID